MNSPQPSVPASPSGFSGAALVEWQRSQQSDQPQRCVATRWCNFHNSLCVVDTWTNCHGEMSRRLATSGRSAHVCPSGTRMCAGNSSIVFAAACQQQIIKMGGNIWADVVTAVCRLCQRIEFAYCLLCVRKQTYTPKVDEVVVMSRTGL